MLASTKNVETLMHQIACNNFRGARETVIAICDENTSQKHKLFCADLKRRIEQQPSLIELNYKAKNMLYEHNASSFDEELYYVSPREAKLLQRIQTMDYAAEKMQKAGINFRNATLMYGPTGVGKSEFAKYIAKTMGRRLLVVNLAQLIDSYLGNTAKNMQEVFQAVADTGADSILFLDEIDAISANRDRKTSQSADRELERATMAMMQLLDMLPPHTIILGATNHVEMLDAATIRRFSSQHEFMCFNAQETEAMVKKYLEVIKARNEFAVFWDEKELERFAMSAAGSANSAVIEAVTKAIADMLAAGVDTLTFPFDTPHG